MKRLDVSDQTAISMPMKNLIAIVSAVAVGVWAYFGVIERLNKLETQSVLLEKDMSAEDERLHNEVTKNTDLNRDIPRGELGQSSKTLNNLMLIEDLYKSVDRMQKHPDDMANNKVNIEFPKEQMEKAQNSLKNLKTLIGKLFTKTATNVPRCLQSMCVVTVVDCRTMYEDPKNIQHRIRMFSGGS